VDVNYTIYFVVCRYQMIQDTLRYMAFKLMLDILDCVDVNYTRNFESVWT